MRDNELLYLLASFNSFMKTRIPMEQYPKLGLWLEEEKVKIIKTALSRSSISEIMDSIIVKELKECIVEFLDDTGWERVEKAMSEDEEAIQRIKKLNETYNKRNNDGDGRVIK